MMNNNITLNFISSHIDLSSFDNKWYDISYIPRIGEKVVLNKKYSNTFETFIVSDVIYNKLSPYVMIAIDEVSSTTLDNVKTI